MSKSQTILAWLLLFISSSLWAAGALEGEVEKQSVNPTAIIMFLAFVSATLGITYWAARRTKSTKDFYAAGGSISGFQNGLAIAGDFMSAASFLGISGLVFASGFDGLIYSIGCDGKIQFEQGIKQIAPHCEIHTFFSSLEMSSEPLGT